MIKLPGDVALAREEFLQRAAVLDRRLAGRTFLVGGVVSVADLVMAYTLDWGNELGFLAGLPNLQRYLAAMYARPSAPPRIAAALASEGL